MIPNEGVDITRIQIIAIAGSIAFILFILYQIRAKRLREDYSLIWLFFGAVFLFFSCWRESLDYLSYLVGVAYPPATIFIILIMVLFLIVIQFSIIITKQSNQLLRLAQEIGRLKQKVDAQGDPEKRMHDKAA